MQENLPTVEIIRNQLSWISALPDGIIFRRTTPRYEIVIRKVHNRLNLFFEDPGGDEIMSVIDTTDPFNLLALYTRAMMLCLLWNSHPARVHAVGFGGGRVPMVLHHLLPSVQIEATDIEPDLADISARYFGVRFDERLHLIIEDGRSYLENRSSVPGYDVILLDVFRGSGSGVYRLSTLEFFQTCRRCLAPGGLVFYNLFESDAYYLAKIFTFRQVFPLVYLYRSRRENVLIGMDRPPIYIGEMIWRAEEIQAKFPLRFSLVDLVYDIQPPDRLDLLMQEFKGTALTDHQPSITENKVV